MCNGCRRIHTEHIETCNGAGILGALPLLIVEVCRHGHHSVLDLHTEVVLSCFLHLGQDHAANLLGRHDIVLAFDLDRDLGLAALVDDLEWKELNVLLDRGVFETPANQALGVLPLLCLDRGRRVPPAACSAW